MKKTDSDLKQDIESELRWEPAVNSAQVGVTVDDGAVTLRGVVDTYPQKWAAERAAKRIAGVRTVAEDLTVKVQSEHVRSDSAIAAAIQHAFKWDIITPTTVTARVTDGAVTLEGEVPWHFQRDAAERAVRHLMGVRTINNAITLKPDVSVALVKEKVLAALKRQATTDAGSINVEAHGGRVTLSGSASSWQSIEDAASAAWSAPGVTQVVDDVQMHMTY